MKYAIQCRREAIILLILQESVINQFPTEHIWFNTISEAMKNTYLNILLTYILSCRFFFLKINNQ